MTGGLHATSAPSGGCGHRGVQPAEGPELHWSGFWCELVLLGELGENR